MRPIDADERTTMSVLDVEECLVLLRWENVGRLAVSAHGEAPIVVPVNFTLHEGEIFFRAGDGTMLDRIREHPVSLQADRFDQYRRVGWSVLVRGVAHEIDAAEASAIDIDTWAPGRSEHLVRMVPAAISGRRLELVTGADRRGYL
ncbi:MAG TPA: pyridoxamine 5'-phosphate oxidase family protein [Acidimicrobiales bacterium]|nr:pyridoxamine 5'-phosphate oxidase family protein [Acidimicrobiales bacterium]